MIVSIGLGEDGVNVCLDDQCDVYSPIRLVELCNAARALFFETWKATLLDVEPAVEEAE